MLRRLFTDHLATMFKLSWPSVGLCMSAHVLCSSVVRCCRTVHGRDDGDGHRNGRTSGGAFKTRGGVSLQGGSSWRSYQLNDNRGGWEATWTGQPGGRCFFVSSASCDVCVCVCVCVFPAEYGFTRLSSPSLSLGGYQQPNVYVCVCLSTCGEKKGKKKE